MSWLQGIIESRGTKQCVLKTSGLYQIAIAACFLATLFAPVPSGYLAAEDTSSTTELKKLTLDALMDIEVTSVSKRNEKLLDAPASLYVITAENIRRSGATTLPEVLRLAPNLQVAQVDPVQYAISARGFNNAVGNKLLVLIDGRTVYTPLFSGVFWEQQDLMLEDIERIEVISGPGATLWGANAVNGVINVITKSSAETHGALLVGVGGNQERGVAVRYGGKYGAVGSYRVYGKIWDWDHFKNSLGVEQLNDWKRGQAGFRMDWAGKMDTFTLQGDVYDGESEHRGFVLNFELTPVTVSGRNVLARWRRRFQSGSEIQLQTYYDHSERDDIVLFRPNSDIFDVEFQQLLHPRQHHIVWGAGYRHARDEVTKGLLFNFVPSGRKLDWGNFFVQDEIRFNAQVAVTLGIKLEHNDYTGMEYLPSARLAWKPSEKDLVWGAISRAVRAPSRLDRDVRFPANPPYLVIGGPNFQSEIAKVYELGFRSSYSDKLVYSITAYAHDWDKLRSGTAVPVVIENKIKGIVYGLEAWSDYQFSNICSVNGGFTYLREDLKLEPDSSDPVGVNNPNLRNDPDYQWLVGSSCNLASNLELDIHVRGVGSLPTPPLPNYHELDLRLGWHLLPTLEISIVGRNLLHKHHFEFGGLPERNQIERSALAKITWSF